LAITDASIHPTLAVADLEKAGTWYADKLGWEPTREADGTLVYEVGDSVFTLFTTPNAGTAQNTVMNWNTTDFTSDIARIRGRGVTFEDYDFGQIKTVDGVMTDSSGLRTAWFKDLDGNIIALLEVPSERSPNALTLMLAASDIARARAWYAEKLGFEPVEDSDGPILEYRSGRSSFIVYRTDFAGTAKNTVGNWRTTNLLGDVAELRRRGLEFDEYPVDEGERYADGVLYLDDEPVNAFFTDSEGNILALVQARATGAAS
jgi:catechol 2,3-dioxygenase-like lactoylglutathione lyase family enzyme